MSSKVLTIARNTFTETLRQPVICVILTAVLVLMILSPSLTMYTMSEDIKLLREIGLSTLFLSGLFIAIFSAAGVITEEIETKTITTVLTKPIGRPTFIIGKFFGIAGAVAIAHYICTIAMLIMLRHGVLESASDSHDMVVITAAGAAILLTVLLSALLNYFYDWNFPSTAVVLGAIFATTAIFFLSFIDKEWNYAPHNNGFKLFDIYASILLLFAVFVIVALAVAFSSRFNIVITLCACLGVFLLGLISDYVFGRLAQIHAWAKIPRALIPNLQVFWISDAIYEGSDIPLKYIAITATYAICYITAILLISIAVFQRRQVG